MFFSTRKITETPPIFFKNGMSYVSIKRVHQTKFLGVHYDEQLKFKHHINSISSKLSKLAGMFHTLHSFLPTSILRMIYNAHVNSLLYYNTPIWCCNYEQNIKPLHVLQKRIIRNITKSDFLAHSKPLFKRSKILTVYDLNKLYMGTQFYKHPDKYVAPLRPGHDINTRNAGILRPPQHGLSLVRNSFLIQGPLNYNCIPANIKLTKSIYSFKKKFKKYLISKY